MANRKQFCSNYLTKLELYCKHWWVQIPINEAKGMVNVDIELGHRYFDIVKDAEHIEYDVVNYWNRFGSGRDVINPTTSVRISSNARPIMIIGQDESIFSHRCVLDFDNSFVVHSELRNTMIEGADLL